VEKKPVILLLIAFLLLFGCKGKPESDREQYDEQHTDEAYGEPSGTVTLPDTIKSKTPNLGEISAYEYTWSKSDDLPDMVIIIDDFGQTGGELLDDFAKLPSAVALAILPDLPHTEATAKLAHQTNHEILIHIPMQAEGNANPGKRFVKQGMKPDEISNLIADFHSQMPKAIAANNHMGSAATADYEVMTTVMKQLDNLGMFFVDSATTAKSAVPTVASKLGQKTLKRDVFMDVPDVTDATIIAKIQGLSKYKGRNEPIVVITHCHNRAKLEALEKFISQVTSMGIKLIPPSKALRKASVS
jgi:hypothetical protein